MLPFSMALEIVKVKQHKSKGREHTCFNLSLLAFSFFSHFFDCRCNCFDVNFKLKSCPIQIERSATRRSKGEPKHWDMRTFHPSLCTLRTNFLRPSAELHYALI